MSGINIYYYVLFQRQSNDNFTVSEYYIYDGIKLSRRYGDVIYVNEDIIDPDSVVFSSLCLSQEV